MTNKTLASLLMCGNNSGSTNALALTILLCFSCSYFPTQQAIEDGAITTQDGIEEAAVLCNNALEKGTELVTSSRDCKTTLSKFKKIDKSMLKRVRDITKQSRIKESLQFCEEMNTFAAETLKKAEEVSESVTRAINTVPDDVRNKCINEQEGQQQQQPDSNQQDRAAITDEENTGNNLSPDDTKEHEELLQLMDVEMDVAELENTCTQSRGKFNLFSAAKMGSNIFDNVSIKGEKCKSLFAQMKELCGSITKLIRTNVIEKETNTCCVRLHAIADSIVSLFRCKQLVQLLAKAAMAVQRLIQAILHVINTAYIKIQGFLDEFVAAKKIGKFMKLNITAAATNLVTGSSGGGGGIMPTLLGACIGSTKRS